MEEVLLVLMFLFAVVGGWGLGIAGFFSARRALREVTVLQRQMTVLEQARAAALAQGVAQGLPQGGPQGAPQGAPQGGLTASPMGQDDIAAVAAREPPQTSEPGAEARPEAAPAHQTPPPLAGTPVGSPAGGVPAPPDLPPSDLPPSGPPPSEPAGSGPAGSGPSQSGPSQSEPSQPGPSPWGPDAPAEDTPPPLPSEPARPPRDLETLLTTRWGIWAGAAALLMAGVFLIRYAVEQSLLGPTVRCVLGFLLGGALIAGAEWLRVRSPDRGFGRDQAPPALAAGGVAILYGAAYGTGILYGLIPPLPAFALLALVSLCGLALSLRHGQLVGAIGVAGAFATPALIETTDPSLPGLFVYLLFVTGAALAVVRYTAWVWLGWATTIAGAVWVLIGLVTGPTVDLWAPALFVPVAAALNLTLLPGAALDHPIGRRLAWVPCAVLGLSGLLVAQVGQGWDTRAGVLLLAPLMIWRAEREVRLRLLPFLAATLFLLLLAGWSIHITDWPDITASPGTWTPVVVQELLAAAALVSGLFAASGLWFQRTARYPLPWASLTASVPVLTLAVCYARVTQFHTRFDWALVAFLLAGALTGTTAWAMRAWVPQARQIAGTHAAGAVAAIALGCGMVLSDQRLTLAISLLLPALAWIEAKADLPALRLVARAVAIVVLIRLLGNWYVLDYAFGTTPVANGLIEAYGVPAAAFALAGVLFRRRGNDLTVAVLLAGAAAFATVLVGLEIRHAAGGGRIDNPELDFAEVALHVSSLAIMASIGMRIASRLDSRVLHWTWRIQGGLALLGGILLLVRNPVTLGDDVGAWPILDWLLPAYLLPAGLALLATRHPATARPAALRPGLQLYALVAVLAWITLEIRHLFHGPDIGADVPVEPAELWAWSGAWLVFGGGLLMAGLWAGSKQMRLAGIAIVALTTVKVFILDMGGLEGLWRVLSFLGLGLCLIGLGTAYQRLAARPPAGS